MSIIQKLHDIFNARERLKFPFESKINFIPPNGLYIMFEKGEIYNGLDRIVRVGTHTGDGQLRSRLKQHFVKENKNRSIFRKNIGRCFLNAVNNPYLSTWEIDTTSKKDKVKNIGLIDINLEAKLERRISEYIQNQFSFTVFAVHDKEARLFWESKIASTLAQASDFIPSSGWLGLSSTKDKIKEKGLWQVNSLGGPPLTKEELQNLIELLK